MKRLLFIFLIISGLIGNAHDPNYLTFNIDRNANVWTGKLSFSTYGLSMMMSSYMEDEEYELTNSEECKEAIKKYLLETIHLEMNKFFIIELSDFQFELNNHSSEISFKLSNVPETPKYWSFEFGYMQQYPTLNTIMDFNEDENHSRFILKKTKKQVFLRNSNGNYARVSS